MSTDVSRARRLLRNPRIELMLVLLACIALCLAGDRQPRVLLQVLLALVAALLAEWAFFGRVTVASLHSAVITGMLVGMLLAPGTRLAMVWLAAVTAIAAKMLLQFKPGRHIFNPAAFGLVGACLLLGNRVNWWGYSSPMLVIILAGALMYRLNRLTLPFSYIIARTASAMALGGMRPGAEAFALPNIFFAFVMLVEPKTSPAKRPHQGCFGAVCGILSSIFHDQVPFVDGDLAALLTVNFLNPLITRTTVPNPHGSNT